MAGMSVSKQQLKVARDYRVNYRKKKFGDVIPSMVGLACALGIPRHALCNLKLDPPKPEQTGKSVERQREMLELLHCMHTNQHRVLLNGGLNGALNSNIVKLALGKHGYSDKQDTTLGGPEGGPIDTKWTVEFIGVDK
jgi:hypothetical protein